MDFLKLFDPPAYLGYERYMQLCGYLALIFKGFFPRCMALLSLVMSFWSAIVRKNLVTSIVFYCLAVMFTYFWGILILLGF